MRNALTIGIASAVLTTGMVSALAQPYPAPPPPQPAPYGQPGAYPPPPAPLAPPSSEPPPAGGDGRDVSHINGQLVKVGEHHEYYYSFRRTNISTNPLGWMLGTYGLSVSYGFSKNIALRGDVNYFAPTGSDVRGSEIGVGLPIYFRRTYEGLFLEPGFIVRTFRDPDGDDIDSTMGPQMLFGWHWLWDSGLNFALAAGVGRNWATEQNDEYDVYEEDVFVNGYMRFGYAF